MNRTILTVDDSVTMRQMIIITLAKAGYEVVEASDGVEALAVAAGRKLDLVITDVNMPNMDGITLVRRLRAQPAFKFTPILVLTTEAGQEFKPLTGWLLKALGVPKERMFENSATRIFYQDKVSRSAEDTSAFSSSVPAKGGTCTCRVVFVPRVGEDVAKKIALSLSAVAEKN